MPLAEAIRYTQDLDPFGNRLISTLVASLPVIALFYLLVVRGWLASLAGAVGALVAIVIAATAFKMPWDMAGLSFVNGAAFGLVPIGWTVFAAMMLYNITVETGQFSIIRRSVASLSGDARIQAILIGFAFGAFLEGAAGAGSPVAICSAMLVGLGFPPILSAVICLVANTSPVCYGGLGVPIITLSGVSDISGDTISVMCGHQLPILSCIVPLYMVKLLCSWKQTVEVWPALVVAGGSFAIFQFLFATFHYYVPQVVLWPLTDIGGGIFSLVVTAIFLRYWKPREELHFVDRQLVAVTPFQPSPSEERLTARMVARAWAPFAIMSVLLLLSGLLRQEETKRTKAEDPIVLAGGIQTRYDIPVEGLDKTVLRADRLRKKDAEGKTIDKPEDAVFVFNWLTVPGTPVFFACVVSVFFLRMSTRQVGAVVRKTVVQMKVPIPTIACMLGLSYVTRYSGMDATLGVAFAETGMLYPFFAAMLGWLGVFLTGTDAGSNALFGSLQKITATEVYNAHQTGAFQHLSLEQAQTLICTANSTGGVMGKMIDAQSICVATAGTNQIGKEATIFKLVLWHSVFLACVVGLMTLLQAYVYPFTLMVPVGK
jgi:L-lactate transport